LVRAKGGQAIKKETGEKVSRIENRHPPTKEKSKRKKKEN
jgi:hypothetical protein